MAESETNKTEKKAFVRRGEDFEALYANNTWFQPSEWDLRIVFGELDNEPDGTSFVEQHTSIALPWLQIKLMNYFMSLQLAVYELNHGKIVIPDAVLPPEAKLPEEEKGNPKSVQIYELIRKRREELLS